MHSADELVQEGIALAAVGRHKEALTLFKRAVEQEPRSEVAWLWLAELVGDDEERVKCLENVLDINPENQGARERLASLRKRNARRLPPEVDDSAAQAPEKATIRPGEPPQETARMECWRCGVHNPAEYIFCGRCGASLREPHQEAVGPETAKSTRSEPTAASPPAAIEDLVQATEMTGMESSKKEEGGGRSLRWLLVAAAGVGLSLMVLCVVAWASGLVEVPGVTRTNALPYEDDFSNPASGWEVGRYDEGSMGYADGYYFVIGAQENTRVCGQANQSFSDTVVEVDATQFSGPGNNENAYGASCRCQSDSDAYNLVITGDGFYSIFKIVDGSFQPLVGFTRSDAINQGNSTNRLRVVCDGSRLALYCNDQLLAETTDSTYASGDIALMVMTLEPAATEVHFDNLRAYAPDAAGQPTATPTSGSAGRIAFVSDRDGNPEIYVMNADGGGRTRLTNNTAYHWIPAWSPDGTRIAFVSDRDGNYEIYVMNADGGGRTRLTNNTAEEWIPAWSPDGTRIAFVSDRDGNGEIYVMNADGSGVTRLTNNAADDEDPAWSPDGTRIAFSSWRDGNGEMYVMNADGGGMTPLTIHPAYYGNPAWSPDGTRIAFGSDRDGDYEIYVMDADGSWVTRLTNNSAWDGGPTWSPDGTRIAFGSERDGNGQIYVMNADGSGQINLSNCPADDGTPAWSPR